MTPNFDEILIHCSSLGKLLTNPKSKADIEQNNLSATDVRKSPYCDNCGKKLI